MAGVLLPRRGRQRDDGSPHARHHQLSAVGGGTPSHARPHSSCVRTRCCTDHTASDRQGSRGWGCRTHQHSDCTAVVAVGRCKVARRRGVAASAGCGGRHPYPRMVRRCTAPDSERAPDDGVRRSAREHRQLPVARSVRRRAGDAAAAAPAPAVPSALARLPWCGQWMLRHGMAAGASTRPEQAAALRSRQLRALGVGRPPTPSVVDDVTPARRRRASSITPGSRHRHRRVAGKRARAARHHRPPHAAGHRPRRHALPRVLDTVGHALAAVGVHAR